jgi:hypothetical protein
MELTDPLDIYAYHLGAVWGRLSSLETLLRVAISGGNFRAPFGVEVGDEIEPDALNRWGYISGLIDQYNSVVAAAHPDCILGARDEILQLRNALAHGIAVGIGRDGDPEPGSEPPLLRLLKFGKPSATTGRVTVDFAANMTTEWLDQQQRLIQDAIQTVVLYLRTEGIGRSPA